MPNINISTKVNATKESGVTSSTKTDVNDVTSDGNSFKEFLSHQINASKPNQNNESEKTSDKKVKEAKENIDQLRNADENSVDSNMTATINPTALSSGTAPNPQADVDISTSNTEIDSQTKGKDRLELALNTSSKKTDVAIEKALVTPTKTNEDIGEMTDFAKTMGKAFSTNSDNVKYSNPEIIDKTPRTAVGDIATTVETKRALISSLVNNDSSTNTLFIQAQPTINQIPGNENVSNFSVHSKVGSYEWTDEVANKLTYMVSEKLQSAQLHINPEHLGPIEVKIQIDNDKQTTIHFSALHADTRQALENAIPQLKSILTDNGVNLANCSVDPNAFANSFNHQQQQNQSQRNPSAATSEKENFIDNTIKSSQTSIPGSVDLFV